MAILKESTFKTLKNPSIKVMSENRKLVNNLVENFNKKFSADFAFNKRLNEVYNKSYLGNNSLEYSYHVALQSFLANNNIKSQLGEGVVANRLSTLLEGELERAQLVI